MNSAKSDSCLSIRTTPKPELDRVIALQKSMIASYREQLTECESNLCRIRQTNEFDVDELVDTLLHTSDDVQQYRNAILFMKNKLDFVLPRNF